MNTLRGFGKSIAIALLFIVLLAAPLIMSIQATANSPEMVKASLDKSNIYETSTRADLLLNNSHLSLTALSDQGVISALNSAITPAYIKTSSEKLIDTVYAYVRGNAASLELSVDISDAKTRFADNIASYVKQKFEALPRCTELKIPSTSIESLLEATCAPIGISSQQAGEYARSEIINTAFFSNDRLEIAGLAGIRESLLHSSLNNIRTAYPYFISLVYILPIAGIVLAVGIFFLSATRRRGVKIIANTLMSAGVIGALAALVIVGLAGIILGDGSQGELTIAGSLGGAMSDLLQSLRNWWLGGAGLFIVLSIAAYIALGARRQSRLSSKTQA